MLKASDHVPIRISLDLNEGAASERIKNDEMSFKNWPYLLPVTLIGGVIGGAGGFWVGRPSWVVPAAIIWAAIGAFCAWSVLKEYKLPVGSSIADAGEAIRRKKDSML